MLSAEEEMVEQRVLLESLVHVQGEAEGDGKLEQQAVSAKSHTRGLGPAKSRCMPGAYTKGEFTVAGFGDSDLDP